MTKVRYSVNEAGELVDREGNTLGRITSITIDRHEEKGGTIGGDEDPSQVTSENGEQGKKKTPISPEIEEVWNHYVEALNASRQTLDDKRRTIIRNALKVRSVEECKRAIDGLSVSPFHNGDNEQRKKYLGIRYALSGIGKESNDERIDKMVDVADAHGGVVRGGKLPSDHPRIQRWLANVRTSLRSQTEMTRGRESLLSLRENGYDVNKLDAPPWVKLVAANEQQAA